MYSEETLKLKGNAKSKAMYHERLEKCDELAQSGMPVLEIRETLQDFYQTRISKRTLNRMLFDLGYTRGREELTRGEKKKLDSKPKINGFLVHPFGYLQAWT